MRKPQKINYLEILINIGVLIVLVCLLCAIVIWCGQQAWILQGLHNKCIAECVSFNKNAIAQGFAERCVC